ncbi:hypothetical protein CYMTET_46248 [Cymbomonas tetramitiformis]|uniref:Uncharacterized protein n=1 Tax=Cymbomonas tetramitiformis TaxID=36881 RepID=A0AAE0BY26_9CHLO|nr:hypothetical protein CYMTET_46248 [Cymbomonas tetramitiformis]
MSPLAEDVDGADGGLATTTSPATAMCWRRRRGKTDEGGLVTEGLAEPKGEGGVGPEDAVEVLDAVTVPVIRMQLAVLACPPVWQRQQAAGKYLQHLGQREEDCQGKRARPTSLE